MKYKLLILSLLLCSITYAQSPKDSLLKKDVAVLVEEMEFMYGYDQTMREYLSYKTFDKSESDRIESLPDSLQRKIIEERKFVSDSIRTIIWDHYIIPKDELHTERMIAITKKYGFPSVDRIRKYYDKEFADPEFNPILFFIHSPKKYWEELKVLMLNEYEAGVISQCQYGYMLWQFTGRKSFQPMLDNGYKLVEEDGRTVLTPTCD